MWQRGGWNMNERIFAINDTLFFIQRGWLNGNHFVQVRPDVVLVDAGYLPDWPETEALINQTGARIEDTRHLICTHSHCDHVGGAADIAARSGCEVSMHDVDRLFVTQGNDWATWWRYYDQEAEFFPVHNGFHDRDVITLGGLEWRVIHAPGHGMGQICLHAPDTGWLISSDAAWDGDFGVLTTRIEGLDAPLRQAETLGRLAELNVTTMYPGHGPIIADGRAAIEKCRERIAAFIEEPRRMAADQVRKIILYGLMMRGPMTWDVLENRLKQSHWFPEVSELYFNGKAETAFRENLDYLVHRGLVREEDSGLFCTLPA
jgi:hydroxyacylglutathione hydrolase